MQDHTGLRSTLVHFTPILLARLRPGPLFRTMADPYRRGKLTRHGWRVAYHLARTMKSRKLELPETLPNCLYPPGYAPGVAPTTGGKGGATDVKEAQLAPSQVQAMSGDKKGGGVVVGGATAAKGGEATPGAAAAADAGVVDAAGRESKDKGKAQEGGQGGRVAKSDTKNAKKDNKKSAGHEEKAANGRKKRRSTGNKAAAAAAAAASSASAPVNAPPAKIKPDDEAAEYRMSESQQAQYNKTYDKHTKGKPGKIIDSKQVR